MPIVGVPRCALKKPFCAPAKFPFSVKRISEFRFGPSYRSLLSSLLNSVCWTASFHARNISIS
ncbi:CBM_collapsed_G0027420.mRNA.1.CDS.1 [Saccharomyces cerevisiae]|nr:CBM_collapsed_G0027420.mRNA.1.CDS.1 [Saccharomyces cerevisiae]